MSEQTIDLAKWDTPPCPRCGQVVTALRIESYDDDGFGMPKRIARARDMDLQPCGHIITGYVLQGERVEWKTGVDW